tara:strand:- start:667 stop:1032 length:366 start_codon:yes stop_codon:yes gene_type:complete
MKHLNEFLEMNEASNDKFVMGLGNLIDALNKKDSDKLFDKEIVDLVKSSGLTSKDISNFSSLLQGGKFSSRTLSKKGALAQATSVIIDEKEKQDAQDKASTLEKLHILFIETQGKGYWKGW